MQTSKAKYSTLGLLFEKNSRCPFPQTPRMERSLPNPPWWGPPTPHGYLHTHVVHLRKSVFCALHITEFSFLCITEFMQNSKNVCQDLTLPKQLMRDSKDEKVFSLFFEYPMTRSRSNILLCGQDQSKWILAIQVEFPYLGTATRFSLLVAGHWVNITQIVQPRRNFSTNTFCTGLF